LARDGAGLIRGVPRKLEFENKTRLGFVHQSQRSDAAVEVQFVDAGEVEVGQFQKWIRVFASWCTSISNDVKWIISFISTVDSRNL